MLEQKKILKNILKGLQKKDLNLSIWKLQKDLKKAK